MASTHYQTVRNAQVLTASDVASLTNELPRGEFTDAPLEIGR